MGNTGEVILASVVLRSGLGGKTRGLFAPRVKSCAFKTSNFAEPLEHRQRLGLAGKKAGVFGDAHHGEDLVKVR
jgi:hypothetical protein